MFAPAGRITARAGLRSKLAALVVRRQALAPKNPKEEGQSTKRLKMQEWLHFLDGALYSSHIDPSGAKNRRKLRCRGALCARAVER